MDYSEFEKMKTWIGFTSEDAQRLKDLGPRIDGELPAIVHQFYDRLWQNPEAAAVLKDEAQVERLRLTLITWLKELFTGHYDRAYLDNRQRIGKTHVRVGLPTRFMFTGMDVVRTELINRIGNLSIAEGPLAQRALNKLLDLELMVMLETYSESYIRQVREAEKRSMQQRIDEVQHMASLGQLAASLAHEIKNPLAGISGAIQIMSKEIDSTHPHHEIMAEILRQIDRLDSAVKDLLIYARPKAPEVSECDVGEAILSCLTLLGEDPVIKSLTVEYIGLDQGIRALLDESQFGQVIANLILNAAQACNGDGRVRIGLAEEGAHVIVSIADNGPGMSSQTLQQALEPFYTTKARGTGLGLPICKRIVESHQGRLAVDSTLGSGTQITISVPRAVT